MLPTWKQLLKSYVLNAACVIGLNTQVLLSGSIQIQDATDVCVSGSRAKVLFLSARLLGGLQRLLITSHNKRTAKKKKAAFLFGAAVVIVL